MSESPTHTPSVEGLYLSKAIYLISRNWIWLFSISYGLFVGLPFLAPVFMQIGWDTLGQSIYGIYAFLCHQLPQRSFFLFGKATMYPLQDIQDIWAQSNNPLILRQFIGESTVGWKVAWSDRMVAMYTSILITAWIWYPWRRKAKSLALWGFVLLILPMALDGTTHLISDFWGIGQGFRDSNGWLALITNNTFPSTFYMGDALGSFNSWMRLLSGSLFGLAIVWLSFPILEEGFSDVVKKYRTRFDKLMTLREPSV